MSRSGTLVVSGIRGRNGGDSPLALPDWQAVECLNIDFYDGEMGQKRGGVELFTNLGAVADATMSMMRHVPGNDETAAEYWAFTGNGTPTISRFAASASLSSVTASDTLQDASGVTAASLNGKLFFTYNSNVNRLHAWDGTRIRRVGMAQGGTPTAANTGGGAYGHTLRFYKISWTEKNGAVIVREGELGSALSFTPAVGALTAVRVTQSAPPGENETHWNLWASADDVYSNYKLIATTVVGTTTFDDSVEPANYTGEAPPTAGLNIPPPAAKFIVTDGNRLLMAGAWETSAAAGQTAVKNNRVWHTRVLGSSDRGDDETIPSTAAVGLIPAQKNWTDVGENDGGAITGLGVIEGIPFVFKQRQVWMLVPTGDDLQPYRPRNITRAAGTVTHQSIVLAEDEEGAPTLYFWDRRGPYRVNANGMQYLGRDVEDISSQIPPAFLAQTWGVPYATKHQVWWKVVLPTLITANDNDVLLVFDTLQGREGEVGTGIRGGWARWTVLGGTNVSRCACPWSGTLGASMSLDLKPYVGGAPVTFSASATIHKYDTGLVEVATPFQAYIDTKPYFPGGIGMNVKTHDAVLVAEASAGVTVQVTMERDFGLEARTGTVSLTAAGSETRVIRRVVDTGLAEMGACQFRIGDASAVSSGFVLDAISVPWTQQESRS